MIMRNPTTSDILSIGNSQFVKYTKFKNPGISYPARSEMGHSH